ncbi:MAG: diguanylate cyclase [Gammaproteobacteria bacterium]|nr:diguanylate cyclase [Gammaproteobacteria bacterium]
MRAILLSLLLLFSPAGLAAPFAVLDEDGLSRARDEIVSGTPARQLAGHLQLAGHYAITRRPLELAQHAEAARTLAGSNARPADQATATVFIGLARFLVRDIERAGTLLTQGLEMAERTGNDHLVVMARRSLAAHYASISLLDNGYLYAYRALDLARELGDDLALARTLDVLAFLAGSSGDFDTEHAWRTEALARFRSAGSRWEEIDQQGKLAATMIDQGRLAAGEVLVYETMEPAGELGNTHLLAWLHGVIARLNKSKGFHGEAESALQAAITLSKDVPDDEAHFRARLAALYLELGRLDEALKMIQRARGYFIESPSTTFHTDALLTAYRIHMARGELENAAQAFSAYVAVTEDRYQRISEARLAELDRRLQADRQMQEIFELRDQRRREQNIRGTLLATTIFAFALVLLLAIRYRSRVRQAESMLAKNRQLETEFSRVDSLARRDPLTGLMNRRAFQERVNEEALELGEATRPSAIAVMDLDHFKDINDAWGHDFGDDVLSAVASTLQRKIRRDDAIARWGGEEFVVLLHAVHAGEARLICEKLRQAVAELMIRHEDQDISVTITIGVALLSNEVKFKQALKSADQALYFGKTNGRDQVVVADEV